MRAVQTYICRILGLVLFSLGTNSSSQGQITQISLDLKNNYSEQQTNQTQGELTLQNYGQIYVFAVNGYAFDPKIATFNTQTSLTDYSSTSKTAAVAQSLKSRNFGYYNISMTLLPNNSYPLTLFASRSQVDNVSSTDLLSSTAKEIQTANEVESMGLRWNIAKNTYFPQLEFLLQRDLNKNAINGTPVKQRNDIVSLRMSNSNEEGTSQYSFQYGGNRIRDSWVHLDRVDHNFQFYGTSKVTDHIETYSNALYSLREFSVSRNIEVGGTYRQTENIQHQLRVSNMENRIPTVAVYNNSVTNSAQYTVTLPLADRAQGTFGALYSVFNSVYGDLQMKTQRSQLQSQATINKRISFAEITGTVGANVGFEEYPTGGRKFAQQSQLNVNGLTTSLRQLQIAVREDIIFGTTYDFGNTLQNTISTRVTTNSIPRSVMNVEVSRNDFEYLDYIAVASRSITTITGQIATRLTSTASAEIQHSESWTKSWYVEKTIRTSVRVLEAGFFRNLTCQLRGEHVFNNFTQMQVITLEGVADYQFYAFTFSGRYTLLSIGRLKTQGVFLEVRRPFSFSLR